LVRYPFQLSTAWRQARSIGPECPFGTLAIYQIPRIHRLRDGQSRDMIYGDILNGHGVHHPIVVLEQSWGKDLPRSSKGSTIDLDPYQSLAEILAVMFTATSRVRRATHQLDVILHSADLPIPPRLRRQKIRLALGLFEARRKVFRRLFTRLRTRMLMVTYAPGRGGEIAAARELGIKVVELQHGFVSAHCPDYAWPKSYGAMKSEMAIPDLIGLFGPVFRRQIVRSEFWTDSETASVGAAAIDFYRPFANSQTRRLGPLRILFMTQATIRQAAIAFWKEFARQSRVGMPPHEVIIKVHPEEGPQIDLYGDLVRSDPDRFSLLAPDANPMEAILDAHVVVAYSSMSLVEALGLGRPAISLCSGSIPRGFSGSFDFPEVLPIMPHVSCPEDFIKVLQDRASDEGKLEVWRQQAFSYGAEFFAEGFLENMRSVANGLLTGQDGVPTDERLTA